MSKGSEERGVKKGENLEKTSEPASTCDSIRFDSIKATIRSSERTNFNFHNAVGMYDAPQ